MSSPAAQKLIKSLELTRHPEGGWFRETYRSSGVIPGPSLPSGFSGNRAYSTAIYFLLEKADVSALHRIMSDEMWHFYAGAALTVQMITSEGKHQSFTLGADIAAGELFQAVVPAGSWFGAEVTGAGDYSLVGCTVAPGFDFHDFEMGDREQLLAEFPDHTAIIKRLTRMLP
ncbi:MAG: cupin domain-containing protein [Geobacter sp.]|nr:cupin domain-containing protein [Geobacter sp.]